MVSVRRAAEGEQFLVAVQPLRGANWAQSEIPNRQDAKNAMAEIAHWEETDETPNGPKAAPSGCWVQRPEDHTLGNLGAMAVQRFYRIRGRFRAS